MALCYCRCLLCGEGLWGKGCSAAERKKERPESCTHSNFLAKSFFFFFTFFSKLQNAALKNIFFSNLSIFSNVSMSYDHLSTSVNWSLRKALFLHNFCLSFFLSASVSFWPFLLLLTFSNQAHGPFTSRLHDKSTSAPGSAKIIENTVVGMPGQ